MELKLSQATKLGGTRELDLGHNSLQQQLTSFKLLNL
jgi:hypothetical protein